MSLHFNFLRYFVLITLLLVSIDSYSQCFRNKGGGGGRSGSSNFSLELGAGMPLALSPSNDLQFGDAKKFELGLRYLPYGNSFGLRGYYSFTSLSDSKAEPSDHGNSFKIHKVELQGIYMLDRLFNVPESSVFELESYLGVGAALGSPSSRSGTNKMLATTIGLRPRVLIDNNRLHLYFDTSYTLLINQQYDYAGEPIPDATRGNIGSMLNLSLGLSYRL